jgi:hypothetical protein
MKEDVKEGTKKFDMSVYNNTPRETYKQQLQKDKVSKQM